MSTTHLSRLGSRPSKLSGRRDRQNPDRLIKESWSATFSSTRDAAAQSRRAGLISLHSRSCWPIAARTQAKSGPREAEGAQGPVSKSGCCGELIGARAAGRRSCLPGGSGGHSVETPEARASWPPILSIASSSSSMARRTDQA